MEPTKQHLRFLVRQDQAYNNPQLHQSKRNHKKRNGIPQLALQQCNQLSKTPPLLPYHADLFEYISQEAHRTKTMTFGTLGITNHPKEHWIHSRPPNLPGNNKSSFEKKSYPEFPSSKNHDLY
jgi:hypothetical protein